nr:MAG TPA: hypothetical protein [Caudoviricetes sp.]
MVEIECRQSTSTKSTDKNTMLTYFDDAKT